MHELVEVVVPCFNEQSVINTYLEVTCPILDSLPIPWGIVFVDDGSSDATLDAIRAASQAHAEIDYVSFSRNFGKEAALMAGMRKALARGATKVIVMDVDLQDPPDLIPSMLETMNSESVDVVATYRRTRDGEPPIRSWFAHRFYNIINSISDVEMRDGARDFRLMSRRVVESIVSMPETQRFSKGLFSWVGFHTTWLGYDNVERAEGNTHWSFFSLVGYALDGIIAFSTAPLAAISLLGLATFLLAMLFLVLVFVRALLFGDPVAGWPSLVCIVLLLSGLQLLSLGIVGLYVSKMYQEVKRRPLYVVKEESQ